MKLLREVAIKLLSPAVIMFRLIVAFVVLAITPLYIPSRYLLQEFWRKFKQFLSETGRFVNQAKLTPIKTGQEKANQIQTLTFYELAGGSSAVSTLLIIGGYLFAANIMDDYTTNVFTEGLGVVTTVLIVDLLNRRRTEQELKAQLLFELGSNNNSTALRALRLLKYQGWLKYRGGSRNVRRVWNPLEYKGLTYQDLLKYRRVSSGGNIMSRVNLGSLPK